MGSLALLTGPGPGFDVEVVDGGAGGVCALTIVSPRASRSSGQVAGGRANPPRARQSMIHMSIQAWLGTATKCMVLYSLIH